LIEFPNSISNVAVPEFTSPASSWQPAVAHVFSSGAPVCEGGAPELDLPGVAANAIITTIANKKTDTIFFILNN
jgi:hypothetical protein